MAQSWHAVWEYRTSRPNLQNGGPMPRARQFSSVFGLTLKKRAAAAGVSQAMG
jgi:hypothetical protein